MNVAIISQARTGSTRLPGKVLMTISDKSLLEYHIERLKWSLLPVIIATTASESDEPIVSICRRMNIPFFRAHEEDVLARYYECAMENGIEIIIRVTSDCPLIDGVLIKEGLELFKTEGVDYLSNTIVHTFPYGFDFEIFTFKALEAAFVNAKDRPEREHVTPYIWRNNPDRFKLFDFRSKQNKSDYRITVDTQEDFLVVKTLIEEYEADRKGYKEIISILDKNPRILQPNKTVKQKRYGE